MSIRKRKWTTGQGVEKEAWVVDYADQRGKRHLKTFQRKKDADTYKATVALEVRQGTHTADSESLTIEEAGRQWLAAAEEDGLERATKDQYRQHLDLHITPFLGAVRLSQLNVPMVVEFRSMLRTGSRSEAMVKKVIASLSSLVASAMERGFVSRNPVREMKVRRKRGSDKRARGKAQVGVDIPTREEIKLIVDHAPNRWRPIILTAIFTGLRASELRGLRWENVDFERDEIHVRERADRYNAIGRPKSEAGERSVPMTPIVANTLRERKLKSGGQGFVFGNGKGKVESHANIVNWGLVPAQLAAGVTATMGEAVAAKYTGLHAFRHFYASWCINPKAVGGLELSPKVVQERMGHASITMTMDVYGHLFPRGDDREELAAAERSLLA